MQPLNPAYSQVKGFPPVAPPHPDVYLRPDGLQGIRNRDQNDPAVKKRRQAVQHGVRFALDDPDIGVGQLMAPIQNYDNGWDWARAAAVCEQAVANGNRIYLRPMTFVQGNFMMIPDAGLQIASGNIPGTSTTRQALDTMDLYTWDWVKGGYRSFKELIFDRFREHIIAIDICLSCSIDGGQPSLRGHLGGSATIMDVFGITRERIIEELELQWELFGLAGIGHISPNGSSVDDYETHPGSDHWLNVWFAKKGYQARRQDSRPFRETGSTATMAERAGWDVILDIYESTAGRLAEWTKRDGDWYLEAPDGGPGFVKFYGTDYPANVRAAFADVRNRKGFIWPMSSYPSKSEEPEYWTHYLEGPGGALEYVPGQIEAFIAQWREATPDPDPDPEPIPEPDPDHILVPVTVRGGYVKWIFYGGGFPDFAPQRSDGDVHEIDVRVPIVNGKRWDPRVYIGTDDDNKNWKINPAEPGGNDRSGSFHLSGRDYAVVTFAGWEEPESDPDPFTLEERVDNLEELSAEHRGRLDVLSARLADLVVQTSRTDEGLGLEIDNLRATITAIHEATDPDEEEG